MFRPRHGMRSDKSTAQNWLKRRNHRALHTACVRDDCLRGRILRDIPRQIFQCRDRRTENHQFRVFQNGFHTTGNQNSRQQIRQLLNRRFPPRPNAQIHGFRQLPQRKGNGSPDQTGSQNRNSAAQGTRKILPEYGHFTSCPGANPRTSTYPAEGANGLVICPALPGTGVP